MIRSEIISFRPESAEQRDILKYISLIEEVYELMQQSSNSQNVINLNSIATSIRQVVLKNDCLQQKNDILDFFFLCEKSINNLNSKTTKKTQKQGKNWFKLVQKNINQLKGLYILKVKINQIQLKRGFTPLKSQDISNLQEQLSYQIDPSSIQVEQDIRLKTLYFFRWCKFIEYGKSIKKLRLKQIDDLRKSLTFNQYAVKFSYFHNWRKISKMTALNKQRFNQIQTIEKKSLFNMTMKSFYGLFEIKKIQEKLCQKVKESMIFCKKQTFYKKLKLNTRKQKSKSIQLILSNRTFNKEQLQAQKIKHRFLFYLDRIFTNQSQRSKSKTLTQNLAKTSQNYSILCLKSTFITLKQQAIQTKENIQRVKGSIKQIVLKDRFDSFMKVKNVKMNHQILNDFLWKNRCKRTIKILSFPHLITKQHQSKNIFLLQNSQLTNKIDNSQQSNDEIDFHSNYFHNVTDQLLIKQLLFRREKQTLHKKIFQMQVTKFLTKMKNSFENQKSQCFRSHQVILNRQKIIFSALKVNHNITQAKYQQLQNMKSIYEKNVLKNAFKSFHEYRKIKSSYEEILQGIQTEIIKPNQLLYAFTKIYQRFLKIQSIIKIFNNLQKFRIRYAYQKCFYQHKSIILRSKQMEKRSQLRKSKVLFDMLKKNQQYNRNKLDYIKENIIERISKQKFMKSLMLQCQFRSKQAMLGLTIKQQKQFQFIQNLYYKREQQDLITTKSQKLSKFLGILLFRKKIIFQKQQIRTFNEKITALQRSLCLSKLDLFIKSFNKLRNSTNQLENKQNLLQISLIKNKLQEFLKKTSSEKKHKTKLTEEKIQDVSRIINYASFFDKFCHQSKINYLARWMDWKRKTLIFEKLGQHQKLIKYQQQLTKIIINLQVFNAWNQIKSNIQKEKQTLLTKCLQVEEFIEQNRRRQIRIIVSKYKTVKQTHKCEQHLKRSIKLKYFSKFVRNSLITKYQKVKSFCAIKAYARNLKQKSWNGLKMMLMRLRDKENKIKTQQQMIVKIDKAMYQSQKSNKLTETIQRFNSSMKKGGIGGIVR